MSDINEVQKVPSVAPKTAHTPAAAPVNAASEVEAIKAKTAAAELEIDRLKLIEAEALIADLKKKAEIRDLELRERTLNLQDLQERLDDRQLKRKSRDMTFRGHGQNLKQDTINRNLKQDNCNHRKGGDGAQGVIGGQGDDQQYAVARHIMTNGDTWQRCLRCGKTWRPPVLSEYKTDSEYKAAMAAYQEALKLPTRNKRSGSHTFQWGIVTNPQGVQEGGTEHFREKMKNVTLD